MAGLNALPPAGTARSTGFLAQRWRGQRPLPALLWRDMLGWGTAINLACSGLALGLLAAGVPAVLAVAVHFAPLPWNLFLAGSVWRHPQAGPGSRALAAAWLGLMLVV